MFSGLGEKKVRRIHQALHTPFKKQRTTFPSPAGLAEGMSDGSIALSSSSSGGGGGNGSGD